MAVAAREPLEDRDQRGAPAGAPRWVVLLALVALALIALFVVAQLTGIGGEHGPGRHQSSASSAAPSGAVDGSLPSGSW